MSSIRFITLGLFVLLFISSCKKSPTGVEEFNTNFIVPAISPSGSESYINGGSDIIFDQETLHTFELLIPEDALAFLDSDPTAEEYVEGMLIFDGDTLSPVGIRYKGSIGAFVGCVSGSDFTNPSGRKTCTKLSMKVKVDWEERDEKFYGLKKLQFHSQNLDDSKMHERLGYWLFREMGVPAPRSVHAKLMINKKFSGLYALTEQIDNRFIKHNYEDDEGNLYKEIWPLSSLGSPFPEQSYLTALETNKKNNPSATIIRNFAEQIYQATPSELSSIIQQSMNIDEIMMLIAVDRTIRNDDGPFHWYCNFGFCSNHNYYWYEEPTSKKLHLIPWDLDNAFENIGVNSNPVTPIADSFGEITNDCKPFGFGPWGIVQRSATCDKLIGGWAIFMDDYHKKIADFKIGAFSEPQVTQLLDKWSSQIRSATIEASELHDDAISLRDWENAVSVLKEKLQYAREN